MTTISIRGARTHNLKNIDIELPRDQLIVITGLSGSGKSSLAFDTLYAEGQRRYVESLSSYARQFLSMMEKPDVDQIEGLSPAIAIEQKSSSHNPRSTVGTITEIYDYLRVLYARVGEPRCPDHGIKLEAQTITQMVDATLALPKDTRLMLLAPVVQERKGEHLQLLDQLRAQGYVRARINGVLVELEAAPKLALRQKHTIEVVIDRVKVRDDLRLRLAESFATALHLANGLVTVALLDEANQVTQELVFSSKFGCTQCGYSLPELEPRLFSFNSPVGSCPSCEGLGVRQAFNTKTGITEVVGVCDACNGVRLKREARNVFVNDKSLPEVAALPIEMAQDFFTDLKLDGKRSEIASGLQKEIQARLSFLINVGLDYLTLARSAETLSGGEAQRIRLASQIGSGLVGVMYILDEPSIGLHQRDNDRLLKTLFRLRDLGNTVIVVEHDEDAIRSANHVIDVGPGAGVHGGEIVAQGTPEMIMQNTNSLTGQYLSGKRKIAVPQQRTAYDARQVLRLNKVSGNNLQQVNVAIPVGLMTCVTGVSGSGKSTLINDTLYPVAARELNGATSLEATTYESIEGLDQLDKVIDIDQSPIGRTPRSNPATYTGLFTPIRELFAATPEARSRGYNPGRFSFNVKGGRCEPCEGDGVIKVEMHFLADIYVQCDVCKGKRYNRETLDIRYKGKNIHEVLDMTVEEARVFYDAVPMIARKLQTLMDVGLSYIRLGQNATTLSGGEAQRIKLARELAKRDTGRTLYILDEPTTGLHFYDIEQLLAVLHRLRDGGNTIVIIEHNLDVIKTADWIIDLGPEGGNKGGQIVCTGTPEAVAKHAKSHTGRFLKSLL